MCGKTDLLRAGVIARLELMQLCAPSFPLIEVDLAVMIEYESFSFLLLTLQDPVIHNLLDGRPILPVMHGLIVDDPSTLMDGSMYCPIIVKIYHF